MRPGRRDLLAPQGSRIAGAVSALVMGQRDRGGELDQLVARSRQDLVAVLGVPLHHAALLGRERPRLAQHGVGDAQLAHVVDLRGGAQPLAVGLREAEPPRYGGAALAHALHVRGRLLVAEARRARQLREQ
jgi:hypothetical protein